MVNEGENSPQPLKLLRFPPLPPLPCYFFFPFLIPSTEFINNSSIPFPLPP